jgi:hypothetical protein
MFSDSGTTVMAGFPVGGTTVMAGFLVGVVLIMVFGFVPFLATHPTVQSVTVSTLTLVVVCFTAIMTYLLSNLVDDGGD